MLDRLQSVRKITTEKPINMQGMGRQVKIGLECVGVKSLELCVVVIDEMLKQVRASLWFDLVDFQQILEVTKKNNQHGSK